MKRVKSSFGVHSAAQQHAVLIQDFSLFPTENEIVLPPNMEFKVRDILHHGGGLVEVHCDQLDEVEALMDFKKAHGLFGVVWWCFDSLSARPYAAFFQWGIDIDMTRQNARSTHLYSVAGLLIVTSCFESAGKASTRVAAVLWFCCFVVHLPILHRGGEGSLRRKSMTRRSLRSSRGVRNLKMRSLGSRKRSRTTKRWTKKHRENKRRARVRSTKHPKSQRKILRQLLGENRHRLT